MDFQATETCGAQLQYQAYLQSLPFLSSTQDAIAINSSDHAVAGTYRL